MSLPSLLAIRAQRPDARMVADYHAWQAMGRQVGRGQRAIQVPSPRGSVGVVHLWDLAQTTGRDVPTGPMEPVLDGDDGLWSRLVALASRQGFTVRRGGPTGTSWATNTVTVGEAGSDGAAVAVLVREVAHVLMHTPGQFGEHTTRTRRGLPAVEADSVAALVCARHGLPTPAVTFPAVASWAGNDRRGERVMQVGERVIAATTAILEAAEAPTPVSQATARRVAAGVDRAGAVRAHAEVTAARAVGPMTEAAPISPERRTHLVAAHTAAVAFYREQLQQSTGPRQYLTGRGFAAFCDSEDAWAIGYAPPGWSALTDHLRRAGFDDQVLIDAGLAVRSRSGGLVDRFRDRIMFPIRDHDGAPIAFLGRAAPGLTDVPKYLGSPAGLWHKGEHLFGLAEQRAQLAAGGRPVIVEGPFDVLAVAASGAGVGLAPCGTALTPAQVAALTRAADPAQGVVVAFDGDAAGRRAANRAYSLLCPMYANPTRARGDILAATLADGQDPADVYATHGPAALVGLISRATPLIDVVTDQRMAPLLMRAAARDAELAALGRDPDPLDTYSLREAAVRAVAPLLTDLSPHEAVRQAIAIAERAGMPVTAVTREVVNILESRSDAVNRVSNQRPRHEPEEATASRLARQSFPNRPAIVPPPRPSGGPETTRAAQVSPTTRPQR